MLEEILKLDHQLFQAINTGLSNSFFDWLMPIMRNKYTWIPLYIGIIIFAIKTYKTKGLYLVLFLATTVGIADFGSASILKPIFKRDRPCNEVAFQANVIARVPCGSGKSFPSTHASDHFSIAIFLSVLFFKKWKYFTAIAVFWAALICVSQVYVGVHFPFDVTFGAIFGSLIGFLVAKLFLKYIPFKA
ncbi:phosphatase PAP2 family protein [Pedobacter alpinus]|uniref:Phosphatase PAP2 family protein n=1 Tax=Pedobacter alpinus TaxID=1590643 RepID=A0ABW5TTB4_9SPHI